MAKKEQIQHFEATEKYRFRYRRGLQYTKLSRKRSAKPGQVAVLFVVSVTFSRGVQRSDAKQSQNKRVQGNGGRTHILTEASTLLRPYQV